MARQVRRISDLPEAAPIQGDELLEMVQNGESVRVRADELGGTVAVDDVVGLPEALGERVMDDDPRLSDSRVPRGGAGGVLSGQYPNPGFAVPMATAEQLSEKVDKVEGKGLSTHDLTDPLYDKLVGLEGTHWRGTFVSLAALEAGVTDPQAGDYANVDAAGEDVQRYIWDSTDSVWVVLGGAPAPGTVGTPQLIDKSVTTDKTDFILDSINLVDPDEVVLNKTFNSSTGELADSTTADATGFIPVVPATSYIGRVNRVAWYRADKSFILSYGRDGSEPSVFTAPADAAFVRVAIPIALRDEWRINEGEEFLPYEPFGLRLDPRIRVEGVQPSPDPDPDPQPDPVELPYAFTAEPVPDYYVPDPSLPYGELTTSRTTTFMQDVYDRYEALATELPDYVNGVNLGPDQSGDYSVWRYTLSPFVVPSNLTKPLPRIAIVCGTHGAEKNSQFALYHFIYDLCHNWQDNEALRYLRWGVIIDLIPCANPWAFENGAGRKNSRGVDLNRNMDAGWTFNPDPESTTYAGTEPFSEVESQYIRELIDDNLTALAVGDYHNHFSQPPEYFIWHALQTGYEGNEVLEVFSSTVIRKCTLNIADRYGLDVPLTSGQISYATPNGKVRDYAMSQGVPAMTLECFPRLDQSDYATSIQAATEYTGNWFLSLVSAFLIARHAS